MSTSASGLDMVFNVYNLNYDQELICTLETMADLKKWHDEDKYGVSGSKGNIIGRHFFKYEPRKETPLKENL